MKGSWLEKRKRKTIGTKGRNLKGVWLKKRRTTGSEGRNLIGAWQEKRKTKSGTEERVMKGDCLGKKRERRTTFSVREEI